MMDNTPSHHQALTCKTDTDRSKYSIGDSILDEDLPPTTSVDKIKSSLAVFKLKELDTAFVRRSDGSYSFSVVQKKTSTTISFTVNANGGTKTFDLQRAARYVYPVPNKDRPNTSVSDSNKRTIGSASRKGKIQA